MNILNFLNGHLVLIFKLRNSVLPLLLIISFAFVACDGRISQNEALDKSITQFNANNIIENVTYYPEEYYENVSDTTLNNGFRIRIKFFSDMKNSFERITKDNNVLHKDYFREFNSVVDISHDQKDIFSQVLDKDYLSEKTGIPRQEFDNLRLENMWIDEDAPEYHTRIDLLFAEVAGGIIKSIHIKLIVAKNGHYKFEEVKYLNEYTYARS